jgi:hypothetical protein
MTPIASNREGLGKGLFIIVYRSLRLVSSSLFSRNKTSSTDGRYSHFTVVRKLPKILQIYPKP